MYVESVAELHELVARLRGVPRLAIDTEFVRDRQYYPQLEIIQIATEELEAILDYRALGTLEPFTEILDDPQTLKIFHAGYQDLEIFYNHTGRVPTPLFDTQVAAAMVGMGAQTGYAKLVATLLNISLKKSETLTDWSRRPLSRAQLQYALNDVRYLLPIYMKLKAELAAMGREEWLEDEWEAMAMPENYRRVEPREAYRRVQGGSRLRGQEVAILRELAEWREREGIRRNRAPSLIVRDNILVELARRAPATRRELAEIRGLHERLISEHGAELLAAIRRGVELPRSEWPQLPERTRMTDQQNSLVSLMQAWLRSRADETNIAPSYLATKDELVELVTARPTDLGSLGILRGWRRRLVGADLLALLEGRASLTWTPDSEQLTLSYTEDDSE